MDKIEHTSVKIQWPKLITTNFTQLFALLYMNIQPCVTIDGLILVWFIVADLNQ
jgi:hypothetical protein